MDLWDPYIAGKIVARKQADMWAEAKESALRSALAEESGMAVHRRLIMAVGSARGFVLRSAAPAWRGVANGATTLGRADQ